MKNVSYDGGDRVEDNTSNNEELSNQIMDIKKEFDNLNVKLEKLVFFRNVIILIFADILMLAYINRSGVYPWGSDTYGHLFKGNILSDSIRSGKIFLNYNESWYNGTQPFRYWAPLPYYILAAINLIANNIITTYNIYIVIIFLLGGLGWLCFGYYIKNQNLCIIIAILWFFVPNNIRILFSEGNLPFVLINSIIPFVFLYYYKSITDKEVKNYIILAFLMGTITLTHAMLAAMTGLSLFILWVVDLFINKFNFRSLLALIYSFLGIMVTSFWLYPALKGGIMTIDQSAVAEVMENLTYPLSYSLNPILRFSNIEVYYFGLAFAAVAFFGLLFSTKNERASFATALIILIGTTKLALPLLEQLPMSQLFWMGRFTSISMAFILISLIRWGTLKKSILVFLISLLIVDSAVSFYLLGFNGKFPVDKAQLINLASGVATQRIGVLDSSTFGSFPSYYIGYNAVHGVTDQVYGWAWQGASTSKNIVMINTALENGYYGFMFDRVLELGADTLIISKGVARNLLQLESDAATLGYKKYYENNEALIYKYPSSYKFGTSVNYKGIAIGSYSGNVTYIFPDIQNSEDKYIDDYSYEELKGMSVIYLSGFGYRDKNTAEELLKKLSRNGVKVVIDVEGLTESFLGVSPMPIILKDNYKDMFYKGQKLKMMDFPKDLKLWKTYFLNGVDNKFSYSIEDYRLINYIGTKDNENLTFIGLNLPYYTFLTKDRSAVHILEDTFNMKAGVLPNRILHAIKIVRQGNILSIKCDIPDVIIPIGALDAFVKISGDYSVENSLIYLKTPELKIRISYPYFKTGIIISIMFLIILTVLSVFLRLLNKASERRKRFKHRFR